MPYASPPSAFYTFAEWSQLKEGGTTLGAVADAAEAVGVGALLMEAALVAGAGLIGFGIGEAILKGLNRPETMPNLAQPSAGGTKAGAYNVTTEATTQVFGTVQSTRTIQGPYSDVTYRTLGPTGIVYFIQSATGPVDVFETNKDDYIVAPHIISAIRVDGVPDTTSRLPNFPPALPVTEPPDRKFPITVPGLPEPIEITPVPVPNPVNDPETPDEQKVPGGVIVRVPETGQEITFTPTGVGITVYKAPDTTTSPTRQPPRITPPIKTATDPCPCPDNTNKFTEVICRLKALETRILDDGFDYPQSAGVSGQDGKYEPGTDRLFAVLVNVVQVASKTRTQGYGGNTPTVYFIGYFSWVYNGRLGERIPIAYLQSSWLKPEGATGYAFALNDGCNATTAMVFKNKRNYIDTCG